MTLLVSAGVGGQVVEFGARRADVLPPVGADGPQLRPVHVHLRVQRLGVRDVRRNGLPVEERHQADALHIPWRAAAHDFEQRGKKIDCAGLLFHTHAGRDARACHEERDAQRRIVDEDAVGTLAMVTETLAVIRKHGRYGLVGGRFPGDGIEQPRNLLVRIGDLAI